jgi:GDP-L-fucose synthase
MKVFVTGGSGFLGRHLIPKLKALGYEVVAPNSKQCDLTWQDALSAFSTAKYDKIFHLAAWTQAGDFCLKYPGDQWIINQQINTNLLAWWHRSQPQAKLIAIGTSCAYPEEGPLVEERYMEGEPTPSLYTYAMTKRMLYQGMRALNTQYGLKWLCVVPSTLYGPGYATNGKQLHFIYDLIRKIKNAAQGGDPPVLWGDGNQRRELIHVEDFIGDLCGLLSKNHEGIFNIGAGVDHSIRDFAQMIASIVNYDTRSIQYDTSKYVGATSKKLVIDKLNDSIGPPTRIELMAGLSQIIRPNGMNNT